MQHDDHVAQYRQKFWLSLVLALPTLFFSPTVQDWISISVVFTGSEYIPAIFGVMLFLYGGSVFIKSARAELTAKQPGMMTLISMAILVAFAYSLAVTLGLVAGMDFWWELSTLITVMLLGHWLEMASVMRAEGALGELAKLLPDTAERFEGKETHQVPVAELKTGDNVLVRPGAKIPADGQVLQGNSEVNEAMLTGESKLVKKVAKAPVIAGTINGSGALVVKVTKTGDKTTLAGIMRLVAQAQASKSATQILADKAAFYLTFIALAAALITVVVWAIVGESATFILSRVVTVLVIACPHALGLAIPLVTAISTTLAAKKGLLIRRRVALETARTIDVVLFDKTGTLTLGEQGVVAVEADEKDTLLALAAAVEQSSEHPIAKAIVGAAKKQKITIPATTHFASRAGRGVVATVKGQKVQVGGPQLLQELHITPSKTMQAATEKLSKEGKSIIYVLRQNAVQGFIVLADTVRPESRQAVATLQASGKQVIMLTGDSKGVAAAVAKEVGIKDYFAQILPEDKSNLIKKQQANGKRVAFVGDGVNDAPALAQADIGIAIGAGTDVAIESADIILVGSDPTSVAKAFLLSKYTYRKMVQNLIWATGYNALALPLAAGAASSIGFTLSPAVGAAIMSLSTVIVALNAQLLRRAKL